jgi:hypothetical protein
MATIKPNDNAPQEQVHYVLAAGEPFDLAAGGSYDSDDRAVLSAAADHPWLTVEYPQVAAEDVFEPPPRGIPYREDPFSEYNDFSNDPAKADEAERAKYAGVAANPLAVDAGLDQGEPVTVGDHLDVTLAAANTTDEPPKEQ